MLLELVVFCTQGAAKTLSSLDVVAGQMLMAGFCGLQIDERVAVCARMMLDAFAREQVIG